MKTAPLMMTTKYKVKKKTSRCKAFKAIKSS